MSLIKPSPFSGKAGARKHENNRIYAYPLPILFSEPGPSQVRSLIGLLGLSLARIENPHCEGVYDPPTRSVWITNRRDSNILWRRGFFGKGDLSRSEPSWLARQENARKQKQNSRLTSEEVREKRRLERQQFKLDRAKAIAAVAANAETLFKTEGKVVVPGLSGPEIPSAATWRPTKPAESTDTPPPEIEDGNPEPEEPLEDIEHLQLTLQEAFFLIWNFDCLTVLDPATDQPMSLQQIWIAFQSAHIIPFIPRSLNQPLQLDNPFLVHYAVYHHYRSLGWVVKGGIKFCVDYLLYKRGPVFAHAEFAVVVCPVYEDPEDQAESHVSLQNATPFSWTWLSTINRVNTQVLKTLILTYVTIPAKSRVGEDVLNSPGCFTEYSVKEVVVRRFIPARMRG